MFQFSVAVVIFQYTDGSLVLGQLDETSDQSESNTYRRQH